MWLIITLCHVCPLEMENLCRLLGLRKYICGLSCIFSEYNISSILVFRSSLIIMDYGHVIWFLLFILIDDYGLWQLLEPRY